MYEIPQNYFIEWFKNANRTFNRVGIEFKKNVTDKYISDFISKDTIKEWDHTTPVFISAQTGSGKSFFIQNVLLDMLVDENPKQKNSVLLLSNRIALSRQSKIQLANALVSLTGDIEYKKVMEQCYTFKGIDKFCYQFGIITSCSYHQLLENHDINLSQFKYIICDECHFFTSDSLFNPNTNEILKKIVREGNSAVRIYMSATPEIAFQPIIWAELTFFNRLISEFKFNVKDGKSDDEIKKMQYWHSQFSGLPPIDINYRIENILTYDSNFKRTILFYYLDRDYNYLKNIFAYKDLEELVSCIEHSQGKWLIFVHSNSEGNKLYSLLKTRSISSVFISRTSIEKDSNEKEEAYEKEGEDTKKELSAKKEYDFIIEHEALNSRVVISTSILDNGINIKNNAIAKLQDKTLNVAINSFDRIQFIQMLGRIRVNPEDNISLFIQQYSIDELKNQLRKDVELLLHILRNDMLPLSGKQNLFDKQYFRYTESPEIFSEYNPCAIYQLIDNIIFSLNTIRLNEPNFFIDFKNDDMRALKTRIYQYYRVGEGKNKPWSRYVFDILETPDGWVKRTKAESNDTRHSNPLYHALLSLVDIKNEDILKVNESSLNDTIQKFFSKELEINLSNNLSEPLSETLSVQLQWINKTLSDVSPINSENLKCEETITDETLKKYCISETDIKENKTDESNKDGVWVKYIDADKIAKTYFGKDASNIGIIGDPLICQGDTLILKYRKRISKNAEGEFRFKWDDKAQWFSVEKVVY